jgi:NADH-quinone oxidoreductase subunit C
VTTFVTGLEVSGEIDRRFPGAVEDAAPEYAVVKPESLIEVLTWLRDDESTKFAFLSSLTAVDRIEWFEVVYHLESFWTNRLTVIKVRTDEREEPTVPSVVSVYPGALLQEREAYDLMGIRFEGNPDLRRIFLWEGFSGFPLRKDYMNLPGGQMAGLERFPGEPGLEFNNRGTR